MKMSRIEPMNRSHPCGKADFLWHMSLRFLPSAATAMLLARQPQLENLSRVQKKCLQLNVYNYFSGIEYCRTHVFFGVKKSGEKCKKFAPTKSVATLG